MKRPFELVAEIQEKDAEIKQLKDEFRKAKEWNPFSEIQIQNLQIIVKAQNDQIKSLEEERDAVIFTYNQADRECEELRKLCSRAADALEFWMKGLASTEQPYVR